MKKQYFTFVSLSIITFIQVMPNPVISFFLKPQPDSKKIIDKLKKPGRIAKHSIQNTIQQNHVDGICVTYAGYMVTSDHNGEVIFPRKHSSPTANIIISRDIEPVALFENTIQHWRLLPHKPAAYYSLKELYDQTTKVYNWHVEQAAIPENNILPLSSIIIISKPTSITIPLITTKTIKNANLTLPDIYVKKGINIALNSSLFLNIRYLFRPIESKNEKKPLHLTTMLRE